MLKSSDPGGTWNTERSASKPNIVDKKKRKTRKKKKVK